MPRQRLGVALLFPPSTATALDALRGACGDGALGRVPPHLTLVPPVNVHDRDVPRAMEVLREAAAVTRPFRLELGPPDTFLPDSPVLYLRVGGDVEPLAALRDAVFRPPLQRPLTWPFVPHVTIADEAEEARIEAALVALADSRTTVVCDRVHLLREERDERGKRRWRPVADAAFEGRAVVGRGGVELELTESAELDLEAQAFADSEWATFDAARYGREWRREPFAITARRDGEVAGVASGWTNLGVAHLSDLIVAASERGQGIGSRLLAAFEDLARRRGCHRLSLRTKEGSEAHTFYEERGWRVEGRFEDWTGGFTSVQLRRDL